MNSTVRNRIMGFMLMGGMLLALPVQAQMSNNRSRPTGDKTQRTERVQSTSRSSSTSARPMQERSTTIQRTTPTTRQQDSRASSGSVTRSSSGSVTRSSSATSSMQSNYSSGNSTRNGSSTGSRGNNGGTGGSDRRPNGNSGNNGNNGNSSYNSGNNNGGNNGHNSGGYSSSYTDNRGNNGYNRDSNRGNNGYNRDSNRGNNGYNRGNGHASSYNYGDRGHNAYRERYSWNHAHSDWSWSRPCPPPHRVWRPAPYYHVIEYRPVCPVSYRPLYSAPCIDRVLGITFGTTFNVSMSFLYTNGYNIDGYENNVVYLRSVNMLNLLWPDVMLIYNDNGMLANAQFIHSSYYNDRSRFNRLYNDLCASYGSPIEYGGGGYTWFGGNRVGYVTLTLTNDNSRYYTNLYIGN
ncbi:MAG: hypothetical protein HUK11_01315 [Muribaculaceae bacterium]|nr:hypothetical protein [Muribaculaceae bacterium]